MSQPTGHRRPGSGRLQSARSRWIKSTRRASTVACAIMLASCQRTEALPSEEPTFFAAAGERVTFLKDALPAIEDGDGNKHPIGSVLNVLDKMTYGDFLWNDAAVPPGPIWVLVDLKAQTMSVFRGEHEIGTAVTLYGVDEKPTPIGRFAVLEKRKDHRSSIYDAPMPYTLRLTGDGVAIHGSDVRAGAGTNGCLGVPLEFGSRLFEAMKVGGEVIIVEDARTHTRTAAQLS